MKPLRPEDPERLGPYRLVARLGAGGMGRVFLAAAPDGRTVAVKAIRPEMAEDKSFRIRFRREVAAAAAVGGIYTAPVLEAAPDAETPWLATAYIPGPTLAEAVAEHGPLPVESVLALGAGMAEALIAVHAEGLVHRDLKPSNVLLAADGPRVIDFGIVRARDGYQLTGTGGLFGSLEYMCPEQATGDPMGPEGDVFCLGSVLAFAACGRPPFSGAAAAALLYQVVHGSPDLTGVPDPLDKIISLCLTKDPALRIGPDRLSAACAPGGVEQLLTEDWLPAPLAATIAGYQAAVMDLDLLSRSPAPARVTSDAPGSLPSTSSRQGSACATVARPAHGQAVTGGGGRRFGRDSADRSWDATECGAGETGGIGLAIEPPEQAPFRIPAQAEIPAPERPSAPVHRRSPARAGVSRRAILATAAGTAVVGGAVLVAARQATRTRRVSPLGAAPEPTWVYRGDPLLQTPAVFNNGTALLKARPGTMICLDLQNGSHPKWVYPGISVSPTPVLLTYGAAVALGTGATVIGVDPADGAERFTLNFGQDFQFDELLGSYDNSAVSVLGAHLQRQSTEQGVATTTNAVFGVDLQARRALVIPISAEDVGIPLQPVVTSDYFVYADGLRNVSVRNTRDGGSLRWRHPVGYDLRPGLAVLGQTVFAIGSELIALELSTGRLRWRAKAEHGLFASLGAGGNTVYATGNDPYGVYAFNAANGSRRWFCETPRLNVDHPIAVGANAVYVPAQENKNGFFAIDTASGRLLWNFTDGRETGVNDWQISCDSAGHLVAQHYDRAYGLAAT
ncbi:PQQ-binding-like beta-propeller repeat protein [Streptomyces sp. NPDC047043]|uniref:serine/threonine-protein kinase n=1 Tax=Streptomyces sp. NPDC047043 TaxID=3154497 RepID=UPI0033E84F19